MIKNIQIRFQIDEINNSFQTGLIKLLSECHNLITSTEKSVLLGNKDLFPTTEILFGNSSTSVNFQTAETTSNKYSSKGLTWGFNLQNTNYKTQNTLETFKVMKDGVGEYCEVEYDYKKYHQLNLAQILSRFEGHILELNHTGINFAPSEIPANEYAKLKNIISENSYLNNYPTGEEWPFVIPCSNEEFQTGISNFEVNRNPKFEMVYSEYNVIPQIQFDILSSLSKKEVLRLLPDPYGVSFDDLKDVFRTVFIHTGLSNVILRFDIRFNEPTNKEFYPWLVQYGKRI